MHLPFYLSPTRSILLSPRNESACSLWVFLSFLSNALPFRHSVSIDGTKTLKGLNAGIYCHARTCTGRSFWQVIGPSVLPVVCIFPSARFLFTLSCPLHLRGLGWRLQPLAAPLSCGLCATGFSINQTGARLRTGRTVACSQLEEWGTVKSRTRRNTSEWQWPSGPECTHFGLPAAAGQAIPLRVSSPRPAVDLVNGVQCCVCVPSR